MKSLSFVSFILVIALTQLPAVAADKSQPLPVPLTRPEMKQYLEDLKARTPRIPLPPLTADEEAKLAASGGRGGYEGRLRLNYMPADDASSGSSGFGFSREPDPKSTLDYRFKTQLFWIVSRTNNCQY